MKRGVFTVLFVFVFSLSFCLATNVTVYNSSLVNTNYTTGSIISGFLNFSLKNVPANAIITSNLGGNMSLKEFMAANNQPLSCATFGCNDVYAVASSAASSKSFAYPSQNVFGFKIDSGTNIQVTSINFSLDSDFSLSDRLPLELNFFENYNWFFDEPSLQYDRLLESQSYGCYDVSAPKIMDSEVGSTRYCEKIESLPSSRAYMVGANLVGTGTRIMTMTLRTESDIYGEECTYDASKTNNCTITLEESLSAGNYYVCITAEENNLNNEYLLPKENTGKNCGFYDAPANIGGSDYSIFVKLPKYASSFTLNSQGISEDEFTKMVSAANTYLTDMYGKDCSNGCVLPVKISGVNQNLQVSAIKLKYSAGGTEGGNKFVTNVYSLAATPFLVSVENKNVDLSKLGFELNSSGTKTLVLSIDGTKILEKQITVLLAANIQSLQPLNPPAGIPTEFTLNVSSSSNITSYEWNFGDGTSLVKTLVNHVSHTYVNKTFYTVQVGVTDITGVTARKNFTVISGSPAEVINLTIAAKKIRLQNVADSLKSYPTWQADYIRNLLKLDSIMTELNLLENKRKLISTDSEFIKLALELNNFTVPQGIFMVNEMPTPFLVNSADVDPTPLKKIGGGVGEDDLSGYKEGISQWERENIQGIIVIKRFDVLGDNDQSVFLMNSYSVNLNSISSEESYFIINQGADSITGDGTFDLKETDGFAYLTIEGEAKKTFNFVSSSEDLVFYVSPVVSELPYEAPLGVCNFNTVCEPKLKENYLNCRSDCKPVGKTVYWIFLVILAGLVLYTLLQEWYKRNYEKILFEDRAHLFNLVSYIDNMSSRGIVEGEIRRKLAEQGWTLEKINYAFKKSKGQKLGMYELIPVEKIFSLLRQNQSKKQVKANPTLMPMTPKMVIPQNTNINKAQNPNQNIKRW